MFVSALKGHLQYSQNQSVLVIDLLDGKPQVQRLAQTPQGFFCLPMKERGRVHPSAASVFSSFTHSLCFFSQKALVLGKEPSQSNGGC